MEVRRDSDSEKSIGPFHIEGFSAASKVRVQHLSSSEASGDVVHDVFRGLDAESRAIGSDVELS